jgi:nucleoside-triphosphatase THEP1
MDKPDLTLSANGESYIDRKDESEIIFKRISSSSSSVIGISGVRGSGKSSLAKKVLKKCDQKGYFSLLIPAPTGYEPREFLLMVFQRICEATIESLEIKFGLNVSLFERGQSEKVKLKRIFWAMIISFLLISILYTGYSFNERNKFIQKENSSKLISQDSISNAIGVMVTRDHYKLRIFPMYLSLIDSNFKISQVGNFNRVKTLKKLNSIDDYIEVSTPNTESRNFLLSDTSMSFRLSNRYDTLGQRSVTARIDSTGLNLLDSLLLIAKNDTTSEQLIMDLVGGDTVKNNTKNNLWFKYRLNRTLNSNYFFNYNADRKSCILYLEKLIPLQNKYNSLEVEVNKVKMSSGNIVTVGIRYLPELMLMTVAFVIVVFLFYQLSKIWRQIKYLRQYPKEYGLYQVSKATLEHLKFQTSFKSSRELGLNLTKISGKLSKDKSLDTRPVSLPGLTSDCIQFMHNVAEVFNEKVVICLDELDKITDYKQLNELLAGIKGIMGNDNHFILTVSEDAMAKFSTRLRDERDIIESSFEDIINLDRINNVLSDDMINKMLDANENESNSQTGRKNKLLIWLFGAGIPREIKRNVIKLQTMEIALLRCNTSVLFQTLIKLKIENLHSWGLLFSIDPWTKYDFLKFLSDFEKTIPETTENDEFWNEWAKQSVTSVIQKYYIPVLWEDAAAIEKTTDNNLEELNPFIRNLLEMILCLSGIELLNSLHQEELLSSYLEAFNDMTYSPLYAALIIKDQILAKV